MRHVLALALMISSLFAQPTRASSEELVYLPSILSSSCGDLCGYCVATGLDHAMGC